MFSRRLNDVIGSDADSMRYFCVDPVSNFTRNCILTPEMLIKFILAQDDSDINFPFLRKDKQISYGQDSIVCQYYINALHNCINNGF